MSLLRNIDFSLLIFLSLSIKIIAFKSDLTDVIALTAVSALYGFNLFLQKKYREENSLNVEIKEELGRLKDSLSAVKLSQAQKRI